MSECFGMGPSTAESEHDINSVCMCVCVCVCAWGLAVGDGIHDLDWVLVGVRRTERQQLPQNYPEGVHIRLPTHEIGQVSLRRNSGEGGQ